MGVSDCDASKGEKGGGEELRGAGGAGEEVSVKNLERPLSSA